MVNGIKVTQNTGCSARTADKQRESAFLFYSQRNFVTNQNTGCEDGGNQIPEKTLFHRGQITGETDEKAHKSESKGSQQNKQDAFYIIIIFCFLSLILFHSSKNKLIVSSFVPKSILILGNISSNHKRKYKISDTHLNSYCLIKLSFTKSILDNSCNLDLLGFLSPFSYLVKVFFCFLQLFLNHLKYYLELNV